MRLFILLPLVLIASCKGTAPTETIGSEAWLERVNQELAVSDGQGHGPDYGSQEWCNVVHLRLYGEQSQKPVDCDQKWMQDVDAAMRKR